MPMICGICGRRFRKPQQLGGHTSKAHPEQSPAYHKKMIRWYERIDDREIFITAKTMSNQLYPDVQHPQIRPKIAYIKRKMWSILKEKPEKTVQEAVNKVF